ncbi:hypothetical protein CVT24_006972 [Panaeolus cyanescens]|uniref:F-box domain-containing protein n=1 Tax=Panaeolus cyanescens TaxID=181874 RepID=A0A409YX76_9AGAR|nr:hypothetical protein CVT24_006972 [Panaeolus cyanescens]
MAKTSAPRKKAKGKTKPKEPSKSVAQAHVSHKSPRSSRQKRSRRKGNAYPSDELPNARGLPALPDELLLEIISYFPPLIPRPSYSEDRYVRGSGFGRRSALVALSLLCSNLRRFVMPYIFETIEVYTGTIVDCGVKKAPLILGGPLDSHVTDKHFATELLRQLDTVTQRQPALIFRVQTVAVELRDFKPQEVAEELVRCLALFPNLRAIRLKVMFPLQKAHLPTAHLHFNRVMAMKNLRHLIIKDTFARDENAITLVDWLVLMLTRRQAIDKEDKFLYVEFLKGPNTPPSVYITVGAADISYKCVPAEKYYLTYH